MLICKRLPDVPDTHDLEAPPIYNVLPYDDRGWTSMECFAAHLGVSYEGSRAGDIPAPKSCM